MVLIPQQRIQPGACGRVGIHVGVIGEKPIGNTSGGHRAFRIHHRLIVFTVDIAPPGLGVADELHLGIPLRHLVKPLDTHIESAVLEM